MKITVDGVRVKKGTEAYLTGLLASMDSATDLRREGLTLAEFRMVECIAGSIGVDSGYCFFMVESIKAFFERHGFVVTPCGIGWTAACKEG